MQPKGASLHIAVDLQGNPAFIDSDNEIHWRKDGVWKHLLNGCAIRIAFGGNGSVYKIGCTTDGHAVYKYDQEKE